MFFKSCVEVSVDSSYIKFVPSVQNMIFFSILFKNLKIKIYKTIVLPVVLYGRETWSLSLKEESRLRVFENRIVRRIFGLKRNENGECRGFPQ